MNIFSTNYNTKYNSIPFSKITINDYLPAFEEGIKQSKQEIENIVKSTDAPTFKNTIETLDNNGEILARVSRTFFNLLHSLTSEEMQKIAQEVSPKLSKLYNDKILNKELFEKIDFVYKNTDKSVLTVEQQTLLENNYREFIRNGANLSSKNKETLRDIDNKLSNLSLIFSTNLLKEINKYELLITDKQDLSGLPEGIIEAAAITAKQKNKDGWIFTLDGPSYMGFMSYADNRELRKELFKANSTRCSKGDELDNNKNIKQILSLRNKRATLLGYKNHAEFQLEETMATNPESVFNFLNDLLEKSIHIAKDEFKELSKFAKKNGGPKTLKAYDTSYYVKKLKKEKFDLDDQVLKPYFKLENVLNGAFLIAEKLYGIKFTEIYDIDKYHKDVMTFEVTDKNGEFVSLFYADFFPRDSKQNGAWMNSMKSQYIKDGKNNRPHIVNVCNFTKPTETKPSLLTFMEVTTLFHELGHGLHGILANTRYKQLSGTSVFQDFVELPSQIFENWCYEKEALNLFAFHYETGELIPDELIEKIKETSNFREASKMLRQLSLGFLDMEFHTTKPESINDIIAFEKESKKKTSIIESEDYASFSNSFAHIFAGGYSAGYYSYKWAEVLDADAFEIFKEKGILNSDVGEKFKETILSKGGTKHPMELYKDFRGKEPDNIALLKRAGIYNRPLSYSK